LFCELYKEFVYTGSKNRSNLTYIKHNLILERRDLFKVKRRQEAEPFGEEMLDKIAADNFIIEGY
jgi:hypothetical protein